MFEESIKQQEAEAAAAAANSSNESGIHPGSSTSMDPNAAEREGQEMKWIFDTHKQQWIQCYVPINPASSLHPQHHHPHNQTYDSHYHHQHHLNAQYHPNPKYAAVNSQAHSSSLESANRGQPSKEPNNSGQAGGMASISLTDSHFNHIKQAMLNLMPSSYDKQHSSSSYMDRDLDNNDNNERLKSMNEVKTILSPSPTASISPLDAMVVSIKNKLDRDQASGSTSMMMSRDEAKEKSQNAQLEVLAAKLPPDWKCKANKSGRIYFYNIKTQVTQWEFPKLKSSTIKPPTPAVKKESDVENVAASNSEEFSTITSTTSEMVLLNKVSSNELNATQDLETKTSNMSILPSVEGPSSIKASASNESNILTSSSADTSFKIFKDQFRDKLSKLVIGLLQPYLKKDCKIGHIGSTDDFKHLARKFTHAIMEKEMSRATKLEELDLNKRIRIKTEEYVSKYMAKFTAGYVRDDLSMNL